MHLRTRLLAAMVTVASAIGLAISVSAAKPQPTAIGYATFQDDGGHAIHSDEGGRYSGVFDRDGSFSFDTGTQRQVVMSFPATPFALFGGVQPPSGATYPNSQGYRNVTFRTLVSTAGKGITAILPGATEYRAIKYLWLNPAGGAISQYGLDYRGDALIDDDADGNADEACGASAPATTCPQDGVEMSKVAVTCDGNGSDGKCALFTLAPCTGACADPANNSNPDPPGTTAAIGQLYGQFRAPQGFSRVARYAMDWGMTICRVTSSTPCP